MKGIMWSPFFSFASLTKSAAGQEALSTLATLKPYPIKGWYQPMRKSSEDTKFGDLLTNFGHLDVKGVKPVIIVEVCSECVCV